MITNHQLLTQNNLATLKFYFLVMWYFPVFSRIRVPSRSVVKHEIIAHWTSVNKIIFPFVRINVREKRFVPSGYTTKYVTRSLTNFTGYHVHVVAYRTRTHKTQRVSRPLFLRLHFFFRIFFSFFETFSFFSSLALFRFVFAASILFFSSSLFW
jgi:hypothetical protein